MILGIEPAPGAALLVILLIVGIFLGTLLPRDGFWSAACPSAHRATPTLLPGHPTPTPGRASPTPRPTPDVDVWGNLANIGSWAQSNPGGCDSLDATYVHLFLEQLAGVYNDSAHIARTYLARLKRDCDAGPLYASNVRMDGQLMVGVAAANRSY